MDKTAGIRQLSDERKASLNMALDRALGSCACERQKSKLQEALQAWLMIYDLARVRPVTSSVVSLRRSLAEAGADLSVLDTDESQLRELIDEGYRQREKTWLEEKYLEEIKRDLLKARESCEHIDVGVWVEDIREMSRFSGIPISRVGSSEEELKELMDKGYASTAKNRLYQARQLLKQMDYYKENKEASERLKQMVFELELYIGLAKTTLEKIGSNADEMRIFKGWFA